MLVVTSIMVLIASARAAAVLNQVDEGCGLTQTGGRAHRARPPTEVTTSDLQSVHLAVHLVDPSVAMPAGRSSRPQK